MVEKEILKNLDNNIYNNFNINSKLNSIKKINLKQKEKLNERNLGIDLIRILGMYAIVIDHFIIHGKLLEKYKNHKNLLYLLLTFCFWHVNSFGIISGMVGYKKYKYSNLFYLWICVIFYSFSIFLVVKIFIPKSLKNYNILKLFFPVLFNNYWYFTEYFHMYLFIPIIKEYYI